MPGEKGSFTLAARDIADDSCCRLYGCANASVVRYGPFHPLEERVRRKKKAKQYFLSWLIVNGFGYCDITLLLLRIGNEPLLLFVATLK